MAEWKDCMLGDLITFQRGHDLPKSKMKGGNIRLLVQMVSLAGITSIQQTSRVLQLAEAEILESLFYIREKAGRIIQRYM